MLPLAGGLFDQPGIYLAKMEQILEARSEKEAQDDRSQEAKDRLEKRVRGIPN